MFLSKKKIIFISFLFLSLVLASASPAPLWFTDRTFEFPEKEYVSAIGSGESEQDAKNDALSSLSAYFGVKVNVKKSSEFSAKEMNGDSLKTKTSSYKTDVLSENELFAVQFTEAFKTASLCYICAYIRRSSVISGLSSQSENLLSKAEFSLIQAESASNYILAFKSAKDAKKSCADAEKRIRMLSLLDFEKGGSLFKRQNESKAKSEKIIEAAKKNLVFSVQVKCDDGSVENCVKEIVGSEGFSISQSGSYIIFVKLDFQETSNKVGIFVKPSIDISLFDSEKAVVASYSKSLPKFGHRTLESAYSKARVEIVKDLRTNFVREIFE